MRNILRISTLLLLAIIIVSACSAKNEKEELFKFKNSYVGDASAVVNIVNQLRNADYFASLELNTKEEPYGIILNYDWLDSDENYKKTVIHNATFLFALVQNVDWITFNFDHEEYKLTRENLQDWYDKNLSDLENKSEAEKLIGKYLEDEGKIKQLFN